MKYSLSVDQAEFDLAGRTFRLKDTEATFQHMLVVKGHIGSGKTLLLKALAGIVAPVRGEVSMKGELTSPLRCCFVHSQPEFNFVTGIVNDELDFAGITDKTPFSAFLTRNVNEVSGGELKRLSVMMALESDYDVILLDEPLDMMDDVQSERMAAYIADVSKRKPLIIATHDDHFDKYAPVSVAFASVAKQSSSEQGSRFINTGLLRRCTARKRYADGSDMAGEVFLSVNNLSVHKTPKMTMSCNSGEILCLYGLNGAGKTLLIRTIAGISNLQWTGDYKWYVDRSGRGVCLQFPEQMAYQESVEQEIADTAGKDNVDLVLDALGWQDRRSSSPFALSDGEKRTLYLVANLLSKRCCIFDEPFAGLDQGSINQVVARFREASAQGKSVIYTANRMRDTAYADRIVKI